MTTEDIAKHKLIESEKKKWIKQGYLHIQRKDEKCLKEKKRKD